jgi:predicted DNA-binding transcriptional regulator AlpA
MVDRERSGYGEVKMSSERRALREAEIRRRLGGCSASTLFRYIKRVEGFPKPFRFYPNGPRHWWADEIDAFFAAMAAEPAAARIKGEPPTEPIATAVPRQEPPGRRRRTMPGNRRQDHRATA